jgi:hypothetical protein
MPHKDTQQILDLIDLGVSWPEATIAVFPNKLDTISATVEYWVTLMVSDLSGLSHTDRARRVAQRMGLSEDDVSVILSEMDLYHEDNSSG